MTCPKREKADHCYHETGIAFLTCPPKYSKVCCHCGESIAVQCIQIQDRAGHGPHLPPPPPPETDCGSKMDTF